MYACDYIMGHILLKQFHLIALDINTVKHPCFSSWTWGIEKCLTRRSLDFRSLSKGVCVAIVTSWIWIGLWRHCWKFMHEISTSIRVSFWHILSCYEMGLKVVARHCGVQRQLGLWLGYVAVLPYGSCRISDQGTTLRASGLHNARTAILIAFSNMRQVVNASIRLHICHAAEQF